MRYYEPFPRVASFGGRNAVCQVFRGIVEVLPPPTVDDTAIVVRVLARLSEQPTWPSETPGFVDAHRASVVNGPSDRAVRLPPWSPTRWFPAAAGVSRPS